jgi:hypothetical protein
MAYLQLVASDQRFDKPALRTIVAWRLKEREDDLFEVKQLEGLVRDQEVQWIRWVIFSIHSVPYSVYTWLYDGPEAGKEVASLRNGGVTWGLASRQRVSRVSMREGRIVLEYSNHIGVDVRATCRDTLLCHHSSSTLSLDAVTSLSPRRPLEWSYSIDITSMPVEFSVLRSPRFSQIRERMLTDVEHVPSLPIPLPNRPRLYTIDTSSFDTPHVPPPLRSCPPFRNNGRFHQQSGRHRPSNIPYAKPPTDRDLGRPRGTLPPSGPASTLASRLSRPQINPNGKPGRQPQGTPPLLHRDRIEAKKAQASAHSKLNEKLGGEEMRQWLRSRVIGEGIMDMSVSSEGINNHAVAKVDL